MSKQIHSQEEEIDLGSFFQQIGKMFNNLFRFINNLFLGIYHYFIIVILFIRKNYLPIGIVTLLGAIFGFYKDFTSPQIYKSKMIVKNNYGSAIILYEKIDELNDLIGVSDFESVSKLLKISLTDARQLNKLEINPLDYSRDFRKAFDNYMMVTDTIYTKDFKINDFQKRYSKTDANFHVIESEFLTPKKINMQNGIKDFVLNQYYLGLQKEYVGRVTIQKELYRKGIYEFDSIRKRYNKVALLMAEKENDLNDLKISTQNATDRNLDYDLYNASIAWMKDFEKFYSKYEDSGEVISIIFDSDKNLKFQKLTNYFTLKYALAGFILPVFILLLIRFNMYLNNYKV